MDGKGIKLCLRKLLKPSRNVVDSSNQVLTFPLSSWLCQSGLDGGWPMTFYAPGTTGLVWCALFYLLIYSSPRVHPRCRADTQLASSPSDMLAAGSARRSWTTSPATRPPPPRTRRARGSACRGGRWCGAARCTSSGSLISAQLSASTSSHSTSRSSSERPWASLSRM